jgi:predicted negative regulator of RcsB-dependent stress response
MTEFRDVEDLTDNEREEQIRRWWSDNWAWIIGGVALGLALLAGWQYWQRYQVQTAEQDASGYRAVVESLARDQREEAVKQAGELRKRRPGSPYADHAEFALARAAIDRREFDEAARLLKGVADRSQDLELHRVAQTRLARVLLEQGKHDEAIALLDPAQAGAFAALFHEIRGDAFAAKGDAAAARREFEAALTAGDEALGVDRAFIELKRDATATTITPAAPASATSAAPDAEAAPEAPAAEANDQ